MPPIIFNLHLKFIFYVQPYLKKIPFYFDKAQKIKKFCPQQKNNP